MKIEKSSFRDNSGFVFYNQGEIFRSISHSYKENYEYLISSGLYKFLTEEKLLIAHHEDSSANQLTTDIYKVIKPDKIDFISYPFEWCFSQLKDAALTTLKIQKAALKYGMTLKDGSVYNIQFYKGKPIFIDTLSFDIYKKGEPWLAYNQFCKNFLAPLALTAYCDIRLNELQKNFIDGIPLDLTKKIIGRKALSKPGIFMHINLHSKFQAKYKNTNNALSVSKKWINKKSLIRMVDNLESTVSKLRMKRNKTEWSDYYSNKYHSESYLKEKKEIVKAFIEKIEPKVVLDFGANEGEFSKIASESCELVISLDSDPFCVEECYNFTQKNDVVNINPIVADLTNPSPAIGWANTERISLIERLTEIRQDLSERMILALAIMHHLSISNNIPINFLAELFNRMGSWLVIEFIPKSDPMVRKLLLHRKDIFENYNIENFEKEFLKYYSIIEFKKVADTDRIIYLMKKS